jgi:hypothetical protein
VSSGQKTRRGFDHAPKFGSCGAWTFDEGSRSHCTNRVVFIGDTVTRRCAPFCHEHQFEALRSLGPIAAHSLLMPTLRSRTKRLPLGLLPLRLSKGRGAPRTVRLLAYRDLAAPTIRGSSYLWMPVEAEGCAAAADYFESIGAVPEIVESLRIAVAWMFGDTKLHRRLCADRRASQDAEQAVKREYSSAELDAAMAGEPA